MHIQHISWYFFTCMLCISYTHAMEKEHQDLTSKSINKELIINLLQIKGQHKLPIDTIKQIDEIVNLLYYAPSAHHTLLITEFYPTLYINSAEEECTSLQS